MANCLLEEEAHQKVTFKLHCTRKRTNSYTHFLHTEFKSTNAIVFRLNYPRTDLGFPIGRCQFQRRGQLIIRSNFPQNCMIMKKFGPRGVGVGVTKFYSVDPPLLPTVAHIQIVSFTIGYCGVCFFFFLEISNICLRNKSVTKHRK